MKKGRAFYLIYAITAVVFLWAVHWGSQVVTTVAENTPISRDHHILIDPGHGGVDGGAASPAGLPESGYNLDIALRLRDLMQFLGMDVSMTREQDISIYTKGETIAQKKASDLKERVRLSGERENTVLLSIHQNHFSDSRYSGAQVFYAETQGSDALAEMLQTSLSQTVTPGSHRKCKKSSGVYLMEHIRCVGVLIECGFLSNVEEEARLRNPEYQKALCAVISTAVSRFLSNT